MVARSLPYFKESRKIFLRPLRVIMIKLNDIMITIQSIMDHPRVYYVSFAGIKSVKKNMCIVM